MKNMTLAAKKLFIKLWEAEYTLNEESNSLQEKSDAAYRYDEPTAKFERRINTIDKKLCVINEKININIINGKFKEDAPAQCELGCLGGYVADCFYDFYQDAKSQIV